MKLIISQEPRDVREDYPPEDAKGVREHDPSRMLLARPSG